MPTFPTGPLVDIGTGPAIPLFNPPAATGVGVDTAVSFQNSVAHLLVQNNTASPVWCNFDAPASIGGGVLIYAGQVLMIDVPLTVLHLFTSAAQQVNSTATGITVIGWL